LPRSPLISKATEDLALYFNAVTDGSFIERSWQIFQETEKVRDVTAASNNAPPIDRISAYQKISNRSVKYTTGTPLAGQVANLIHGAVGAGSFFQEWNKKFSDDADVNVREQFSFYEAKFNQGKLESLPINDKSTPPEKPTTRDPYVYAVKVKNPYVGPATKDTGAIEIFMNALSTLELSKCVPYINLELISLRKTVGTVAPSLSLIGYLNPSSLGSADKAIISSQAESVRSEVLDLGAGIRSGIELFTSPQTLVNLGQTGPEFVPVIDRFRPLASLGNLTLSTKMQGGIISFTTGRLEITIHDRSRLREMAAFVRPDLYGTTFLDITYGWSHPDGGVNSPNPIGKFLDALKTQTRYRISNSTYSFEEGGQVKVTLSIQTVGSIDLLYLGPRNKTNQLVRLEGLLRDLSDRLSDLRASNTAPSMAQYDFLSAFNDPASALSSADDEDKIKNIQKLLDSGKADKEVSALLRDLFGASAKVSAGSAVGDFQNARVQEYDGIINQIPSFSQDALCEEFAADSRRIEAMSSIKVYYEDGNKGEKIGEEVNPDSSSLDDFYSFGSVFMKMVAEPLKKSNQYEEIQVIFYPFNKCAGAVHGLPISCFPIEKGRFKKAIEVAAKDTPEISCRQLIGILNSKFTGFDPARPYLRSGFYDDAKAEEGVAEENKENLIKKENGTTAKIKSVNVQKTFEERLGKAGISEKKFIRPRVEIAVEAAKLLGTDGNPVIDDQGKTKTVIKIHIYDAASDPHSTLSEIITAAKDNELGVIQTRIANFNSAVSGRTTTTGVSDASQKNQIPQIIQAGIDTGVLEAVDVKTLQVKNINSSGDTKQVSQEVQKIVDDMTSNSVFYRVKGDFEGVKRMVSAGMPTIFYGSSTSAVTNVSITTGGGAGTANVMLQRAFTSPAEVAAENIDTGVPMQILPAQLSMGTIGCPLFHPMQRFFIDFGTGTSLDSVYYVISVDTTIGKEGYKTDLKMGYSSGYPTYTSLNKQLAMMAANFATAIHDDGTGVITSVSNDANNDSVEKARIESDKKAEAAARNFNRDVTEATIMAGRLLNDSVVQGKQKLKQEFDAAQAKIKQAAAEVVRAAETPIGGSIQAAKDASNKLEKQKATAKKLQENIDKLTRAQGDLDQALRNKNSLTDGQFKKIIRRISKLQTNMGL
jgi:hypothetical protein